MGFANFRVRSPEPGLRTPCLGPFLISLQDFEAEGSRDLLRTPSPKVREHHFRDATFLLTVGSFLLTVELFTYGCVWELFCLQLKPKKLTIEAFLPTAGGF